LYRTREHIAPVMHRLERDVDTGVSAFAAQAADQHPQPALQCKWRIACITGTERVDKLLMSRPQIVGPQKRGKEGALAGRETYARTGRADKYPRLILKAPDFCLCVPGR